MEIFSSSRPPGRRRLYFIASFVLVGSIAGIGGRIMTSHPQNVGITTLRAVLTGKLALPITPDNISSIPLYQINTNIWGTLLSSDVGEGLARIESISKDERSYQLRLRSGIRFSDGAPITPEDVVFSLRRLMSRQESGHFNAKAIIKSIAVVSSDEIVIDLNHASKAFQYLLSLCETGIIPRDSVDEKGNLQTLSITSGAYSVEGEPTTDHVTLTKNPFFLDHAKHSPDRIEIQMRRTSEELTSAIKNPETDFFEIYETSGLTALDAIKNDPRSAVHLLSARPSLSVFLSLDPEAMPLAERLAVSDLIAKKLNYRIKDGVERRSFELLPPGTFATLNLSEPLHIADTKMKLPTSVNLRLAGAASPMSAAVIETLEKAGVSVTVLTNDDKRPSHIFLLGQGMNLESPEIEFHLAMVSPWAYMPASDAERTAITAALHTTDEATRFKILQKLGRSLIEEGRIVPLVVRSYVHGYRDSVTMPVQADYDGDIHFWRMEMKGN